MTNWRPIFALFEQSMRTDLRAGWIAIARAALLGVVLFSLFPIQQMASYGVFSAPGLHFFQIMSWTSLVGITLAGISYFAAVITEDKEDRTLGLLRMTDLSPVAILLGKSTGRLVTACLFMAMTLPFLLLAVTLGGVALHQIAATYVCLISYLVLVANIALLWSVIFARTATASAVTLFSFFLIFALPPLLGAIAGEVATTKHWLAPFCPAIVNFADAMLEISPFVTLARILTPAYNGAVFGVQALTNLAIAAVLFGLSWLVFEPCNRTEKEVSPVRISLRRRTSRASRYPAGATGPDAITRKDLEYLGGGRIGIAARVVGTAIIIGICLYITHRVDHIQREAVGGFLIFIPLIVAGLNLVMDTERMFGEEVRWKTLPTLMSLPYTPKRIARSKVWYPLRTTLPILAFVPVGIVLVPHETLEAIEAVFEHWEGVAVLGLFLLGGALLLYLTAFLSIYVRRGAALLAILTLYLGGSILGVILALLAFILSNSGMHRLDESLLFIPAYGVLIVSIAAIHYAIPNCLAKKSME